MSRVLQLARLQIIAGKWQRWFAFFGALAAAVCLSYPPTTQRGRYLPLLVFAGVTAIFLGGTLMPVIVSRLTRSRQLCALPGGRLNLFIAAFLIVALVSLPLPLLIGATLKATFASHDLSSMLDFVASRQFLQIYAIVFWICTAVYFLQALFANLRSFKGVIAVLLALAALGAIPRRLFLPEQDSINPFPFVLVGAAWLLFAVYVFWYPTWRHVAQLLAQRGRATLLRSFVAWDTRGQEFALLLGLQGRWIQALAYVVVLALTYGSIADPGAPKLFFFSMYAVVAGAVVGVVASKSRALWLRCAWSRDELFLNVEWLAWRQMGIAVGVLVFWFVVAGLYSDGAAMRVAVGAVFISLVYCVCLYISLLQTRGTRWADAGVAMALMLPTMAMAAYGSSSDANIGYVTAFEALLVVAAVLLRVWAKHRWTQLDWMVCRPMRVA
jgi:hypothetical protein